MGSHSGENKTDNINIGVKKGLDAANQASNSDHSQSNISLGKESTGLLIEKHINLCGGEHSPEHTQFKVGSFHMPHVNLKKKKKNWNPSGLRAQSTARQSSL